MPQLSIVTTLFRSAPYLSEFLSRMQLVLKKIGVTHEFIFVDDGSPDNSSEMIKERIASGLPATLIKFSRNYGHHKAMVCGLAATSGDHVFLIDCDLEEEPEQLEQFYSKISQSDFSVIIGVQKKRNKDALNGAFFWWLLGKSLGDKFDGSVCTMRIMKKEYVKKLVELPQKEFILADFTHFLGYKQATIRVEKRNKGSSSYSFKAKMAMLSNILFSGQGARTALTQLSLVACGLSLVSFVGSSCYLLLYLSGERYLTGWLSIIVLMSLFASFTFFFIAVLMKQTSRILVEVENKPRYNIEYIVKH